MTQDDRIDGQPAGEQAAADEIQADATPAGEVSPGGEAVLDGGDGGELKPLKLDYKQTFKVGFAFAIVMIFWTAYDFVVPLLLEHAYGLSNTVRGLIMGLDNLLSLFMLPLFGRISDNAKGKLVKKWGRRTPFIVIGTIASVILMVFVPISTLNQQKKAMEIENGYLAQLARAARRRRIHGSAPLRLPRVGRQLRRHGLHSAEPSHGGRFHEDPLRRQVHRHKSLPRYAGRHHL